MQLAGKFIVIDGPDGGGKGTQLQRLADLVRRAGGEPVFAKDPGGTPIGDRIRRVLLDYDLTEMAPRCEALLFMASRAQLVHELVRPALAAGKTVLGDRFISATCAYQVAAGFPADEVIPLGHWAVAETWPDLTIILDLPPEIGFARTGRTAQRAAQRRRSAAQDQLNMFADAQVDAMEARPMDYHRRVRELFQALPSRYPRPVELIDAEQDPEIVFTRIEQALSRVFS